MAIRRLLPDYKMGALYSSVPFSIIIQLLEESLEYFGTSLKKKSTFLKKKLTLFVKTVALFH